MIGTNVVVKKKGRGGRIEMSGFMVHGSYLLKFDLFHCQNYIAVSFLVIIRLYNISNNSFGN